MIGAHLLSVAAALLLGAAPSRAMPNGLGQTPPMAWSSWNFFAFKINETIALEIGDALISTGLAKLGYVYVNIDAGSFDGNRDANGKIIPNAEKYPHGMRWLSDQLHAKGLKFGVYTDISNHTCGGSGSMGHYKTDAETYAHDWQVDYLKVDFCGETPGPTNITIGRVSTQPVPQYDAWMALGKELNATGRPIYYSICPHRPMTSTFPGEGFPGVPKEWATDIAYSPPPEWTRAERHALANSILVEYTNTFDSWYEPVGTRGHGGMITDIDSMIQLTNLSYSGPGSWNDADMLQLCTYGKGGTPHSAGGMTLPEYRSHYSVWAILASPLIISADIRTLKEQHPDCLALMLNSEIVAINQDPAGLPPRLVSQKTNRTTTNATCRAGMASGGDLAGSGNFTLAAANKWCKSHAKCAGYTADAACGASASASPTATYAVHFKDPWGIQRLSKNASWSSWASHGDRPGAVPSSSDITSQVFARPLAGGELAIVLLNRAEAPAQLSVTWAELHLPAGAKMNVRDVAHHKDLPAASGSFSATVGKHDVAFVRLLPTK